MTESVEATTEAVGSVVREVLDRVGDDAGRTWRALGAAGLLALPVPEDRGGEGLGLAEVGVLLWETGRRALPLPVWETLCCGVLTLAAAGSPEQSRRTFGTTSPTIESRWSRGCSGSSPWPAAFSA
ncbi:acyl-CoA dehydrogenase family protein [Nocardioides pyridinolyticus]